jgi:hypothetical protein
MNDERKIVFPFKILIPLKFKLSDLAYFAVELHSVPYFFIQDTKRYLFSSNFGAVAPSELLTRHEISRRIFIHYSIY